MYSEEQQGLRERIKEAIIETLDDIEQDLTVTDVDEEARRITHAVLDVIEDNEGTVDVIDLLKNETGLWTTKPDEGGEDG